MISGAAASKASWMVAASVAAVEALKDQGDLCRWNYALRNLHQHAKNKIGSTSQTRGVCSSFVEERLVVRQADADKTKKSSEESLRKVMYLSCWGPN